MPIDRECFWKDSKVVLGYINNGARRFHVYVADRVQITRDATEFYQWYYIESASNPADQASRGLRASENNNSAWLIGPPLLWQPNIGTQSVEAQLHHGDPEVKFVRTQCTKTKLHRIVLDILSRFSSWTKLISFVGRMQRLSNSIKGTHPPTPDERLKAELTMAKFVQHDTFVDAISTLHKSVKLPRTNSLKPLEPVLYDELKGELVGQPCHHPTNTR